MTIHETILPGVFFIDNFYSDDERGSFTKTFHSSDFSGNHLCSNFTESYFSISKLNVIRGMHFQIPPFDHEKLVYVAHGEALDVIVDLRQNSSTFGQSISVLLSPENHKSVYIPKGLAHGFRSLKDDTIMVYNVSTVYNKNSDSGIHYNSFGFDWNIYMPIVSARDQSLMSFEQFSKENPFR